MTDAERFLGTWNMISFEMRISNGSVVYPVGKEGAGLLWFDDRGNMSAQIMRIDRPLIAAGDQRCGTDEEVRANYEGILSYWATYAVDEKNGVVTYRVISSLFKNWEKSDQMRRFEFDGDDRLYLQAPTLSMHNLDVRAHMRWRRVRSVASTPDEIAVARPFPDRNETRLVS